MFRVAILLGLVAIVSGCATNGFNLVEVAGSPRYEVPVTDARSELSRKGGKEQVLDSHYYHGDAIFTPSRLEMFKAAVSEVFDKPPRQVILRKFDVVDSYAKRLRGGQAAALASISYAAAIAAQSSPIDSDFIACVIEATVDGRDISSTALAPYAENTFSINVFNDPSYIAAVKKAVSDSIQQWKSHATQRSR